MIAANGPTSTVDTTTTSRTSPAEAREAFRAGLVTPTAGWCAGWAQANLVAVPLDWAWDVLLFAQRNPAPCPLLEVTDPGATEPLLAPGADLRTDLPRYHVWRDGRLVDELSEVTKHWRPDLVTFLIGCSFTFETGLAEAGIPLRHHEQGRNVAMYRTNQQCQPAGRLSGPLVVSMRPIPGQLVPTAVQVTARMPAVHGAPLHVGAPETLGITDLDKPDFGEPARAHPGDVPVFWACGVTPQAALMASKVPFALTHAPGHMLITERSDVTYRRH